MFCLPGYAKAGDEVDLDYLGTVNSGWYLISSNGKYSAQGFIPNQDNLTRVQFYSRYQETAATTSPAIFGICKDDISALTTNLATTNCLTSTTSGELIATTSVIYYKQWTAEFDDPVSLDQGEQYYFVWQNNWNVYTGTALKYPCGGECYDPAWSPFISCGEFGCFTNTLFSTYYNLNDYLVQFTDDYFDGEPIYKNFDYWNIDYILSENSWGDFSININIYDQNEELIETQLNSINPNVNLTNEIFENTYEFANGKYYVSLDLISNDEIVATEDKKAFFINNDTGDTVPIDEQIILEDYDDRDEMLAHACDDISTSSWDVAGQIECGFTKLAIRQFVATSSSWLNLHKTIKKVDKWFPLSVFSQVKTMTASSSASSTITNIKLSSFLPGGDPNALLFSPTLFKQGISESAWSKIYYIMEILLYISFFLYVVKRLFEISSKSKMDNNETEQTKLPNKKI